MSLMKYKPLIGNSEHTWSVLCSACQLRQTLSLWQCDEEVTGSNTATISRWSRARRATAWVGPSCSRGAGGTGRVAGPLILQTPRFHLRRRFPDFCVENMSQVSSTFSKHGAWTLLLKFHWTVLPFAEDRALWRAHCSARLRGDPRHLWHLER